MSRLFRYVLNIAYRGVISDELLDNVIQKDLEKEIAERDIEIAIAEITLESLRKADNTSMAIDNGLLPINELHNTENTEREKDEFKI